MAKKSLNKFVISSFIGLVLLTGSVLASSILATAGNDDNVTICHRSNSVTNPYVQETVDPSSIDGQGKDDHSQHTGPVATSQAVAQALKDNHEDWGDIIPNILNWTPEGIAIYNNGCNYVTASPSPSASASPSPSPSISPSPSPSPSTSTSPSPSPSSSPTASPSPSPSVSASPSPSASYDPNGGDNSSPTPSPTSSSSSSSSSSDSSSSSNSSSRSSQGGAQGSTGEVLGASTMANTGSSQDLMTLIFVLGIVLVMASARRYATQIR